MRLRSRWLACDDTDDRRQRSPHRSELELTILAALVVFAIVQSQSAAVAQTTAVPRNRGPTPRTQEPPTAPWQDRTAELLPRTGGWTHRVELADLDGDGRVDLLFANGAGYSTPEEPELNQIFLSRGPGLRFEDQSRRLLGGNPDFARVIKVRDLNGDGFADVVVGTTFETASRLYLGRRDGDGPFNLVEVSTGHLPRTPQSIGDLEVGDVDDDGDLDLVLVDWGPGDAMTNDGGPVLLWLNDGAGRFTDATAERMPVLRVLFSWDLEFADVDDDWDLDVLVSSKRGGGGILLRNDGAGFFEADRRALPAYTNNYDYEAIDLDGDGDLDLVTVNDGEIVDRVSWDRRQHLFLNERFEDVPPEQRQRFVDATPELWPDAENPGHDDNMVAFLDHDSDGDADFLLASLTGPDRLLINDGHGRLRMVADVLDGEPTPGTLHLALADLDGDARLDVVMAQGENPEAVQERIYLGTGLEPDTAPPRIDRHETRRRDDGVLEVRARIHDGKSPSAAHDWRTVELRRFAPAADDAGADGRADEAGSGPSLAMPHEILPLRWVGEYQWRSDLPLPPAEGPAPLTLLCAVDAAGNESCVEVAPRPESDRADSP